MNDEMQIKIEKRAFEIWQREGCPDGRSEEHWQIAMAELGAEEAAAAKPRKAPKATTAAASKSTRASTSRSKSSKTKAEATATEAPKKAGKKKK